jgi:hypothetical protein
MPTSKPRSANASKPARSKPKGAWTSPSTAKLHGPHLRGGPAGNGGGGSHLLRFKTLDRLRWAGWNFRRSHFPELREVLRLWSFAFSDPGLSVRCPRGFPGKNPVGDGSFPFFEFAFDVHGHRRPPPILGVKYRMASKRSAGFSRLALDSEMHWPSRLKSALHLASQNSQIMTRASINRSDPFPGEAAQV